MEPEYPIAGFFTDSGEVMTITGVRIEGPDRLYDALHHFGTIQEIRQWGPGFQGPDLASACSLGYNETVDACSHNSP